MTTFGYSQLSEVTLILPSAARLRTRTVSSVWASVSKTGSIFFRPLRRRNLGGL